MHSSRDALDLVLTAAFGEQVVGPEPLNRALDVLGLPTGSANALVERVYQVRRDQDRLRRRERELTALFSSARELAEVRDADALLTRLVERAHEMMGSDVTYLSEFDPATETLRVRTTVGSVSRQFQQLVVPPGRGLASLVVQTRSPQHVTRYADEWHEDSLSSAVSAEGLVSLLGVPLLSDQQVLGVLFVATRDEHTFGPEQIALLAALANHASVVLQTAQRLHHLQRSQAEAAEALARLTGHLAERDRANAVHQQLVQSVLEGSGFAELAERTSDTVAPIAEVLAQALDRGVAVVNEYGEVLVTAGAALSIGPAVRAAIEASHASGRCVPVPDDDSVGAVAALTAGRQHFGAVLLGKGFPLSSVDERTIERGAQVGTLLAMQRQAVADAEHRRQGELLADLLDAAPQRRRDAARRARQLRVQVRELDTVLLFAVPGEHRARATRVMTGLLADGALVGEYGGYAVAAMTSTGNGVQRVHDRLAEVTAVLGVSAGVRGDLDDLGGLPAAFVAARRTARLVDALGVTDGLVRAEDYHPYAAVFEPDRVALEAFLTTMVEPVRHHDEAHGTDLLATLRAFVRNQASPTRTARQLNFHTNTILQRLDRLTRLLGPHWRSDEHFFRLSMAVRLDELAERLRHD